jgi:hypothetical protein
MQQVAVMLEDVEVINEVLALSGQFMKLGWAKS